MISICKTLNGDKFWVIPNTEKCDLSYCNLGVLHREDGPAKEWLDGDKSWYIIGKRHRKDGPAIEQNNNKIDWYLNNKPIKPTIKMMEKYIKLNPDNILKDYEYPLEIQLLAISLKKDVIYNIKHLHIELKRLYPKQMALRDSGLI